jgi:hypothetical protein
MTLRQVAITVLPIVITGKVTEEAQAMEIQVMLIQAMAIPVIGNLLMGMVILDFNSHRMDILATNNIRLVQMMID